MWERCECVQKFYSTARTAIGQDPPKLHAYACVLCTNGGASSWLVGWLMGWMVAAQMVAAPKALVAVPTPN